MCVCVCVLCDFFGPLLEIRSKMNFVCAVLAQNHSPRGPTSTMIFPWSRRNLVGIVDDNKVIPFGFLQ